MNTGKTNLLRIPLGKGGFSLIEMVVSALILSAIITSFFPLFSASTDLLESYHDREEVVENARISIRQLVRETRYATTIYNATTSLFEMGSLYLVDSDSGEEKTRYRLVGSALLKSIDTGGGYGSEFSVAENVSSFVPSYNNTTRIVSFQLSTTKDGKAYTTSSTGRLRTP